MGFCIRRTIWCLVYSLWNSRSCVFSAPNDVFKIVDSICTKKSKWKINSVMGFLLQTIQLYLVSHGYYSYQIREIKNNFTHDFHIMCNRNDAVIDTCMHSSMGLDAWPNVCLRSSCPFQYSSDSASPGSHVALK